jgi:glutamate 5-kinase
MKPNQHVRDFPSGSVRGVPRNTPDWRPRFFLGVQRAVIKVGSGVLTGEPGLDLSIIRSLARQISRLGSQGVEVILVSSGAVASGMKKIGMKRRPMNIPEKQAAAAVGQAGLMYEYEKAFEAHSRLVAQVLLTRDDIANRTRYLNARNTLRTLLSWNIVPVINENDTVVVQELKFGDNDNLAAMISQLMDADVCVILSDVEGLYEKDPRLYKEAPLVRSVERVSKSMEEMAAGGAGALGTGGMLSKLRAARKTTAAGIPMVVCLGSRDGILDEVFSGRETGTFFFPRHRHLASRKCWLAYATKAKGALLLDDGAVAALVQHGKSLLPVGVREVSGEFSSGSPVELNTLDGKTIARGLVNYNSADLRKIIGKSSRDIEPALGYKLYDEVIHRDNLVVFEDKEEGACAWKPPSKK